MHMFLPQGTLIHLAYMSGGCALPPSTAGELGLRHGWNVHRLLGKRRECEENQFFLSNKRACL